MGSLWIIVSAMAFGSLGILSNFAYQGGANVGSVLFYRFLLAALILWALVLAKKTPIKINGQHLFAMFLLGAVGYAAQSYLFLSAVGQASPGMAAILLYTYPAMVFLVSVLLRQEQATWIKLICLGLTFTGTVLILAQSIQNAQLNFLGIAYGLGAAAVFSFYLLLSGRVAGAIDSYLMTALICTFAAFSLGLTSWWRGDLIMTLSNQSWMSIGGIALVSTVLAVVALNLGLAKVNPAKASLLSTVEPVFTVLLSYLIFDEILTGLQMLGGLLILLGVILLQLKETIKPQTGSDLARETPML